MEAFDGTGEGVAMKIKILTLQRMYIITINRLNPPKLKVIFCVCFCFGFGIVSKFWLWFFILKFSLSKPRQQQGQSQRSKLRLDLISGWIPEQQPKHRTRQGLHYFFPQIQEQDKN